MFELENSINKWLKGLRGYKAFEEGTIQEMELHLRDNIEDLVSQGLDEKTAFEKAVHEFGAVNQVAKEEDTNVRVKPTLRTFLFRAMLNNYFKTSMRTMLKNPLNSFINVFGLAVAIGACLVTYAFIDFDLRIDRFHTHTDELFLSTYYVDRAGTTEHYGNSPAPLAEHLRKDFPGIKEITRIHNGNAVVKHGDKVFHESIRYVDPEFLRMFTFPLKWGVPSALKDVNSIILSEEMALKYFDEANPVGEEVKVIVGDDLAKVYRVAGVAAAFPKSRIIDFDFLTNIENMKIMYPSFDFSDWRKELNATFVQVADASELKAIKSKMNGYKALQNEVETDWPISAFDFVSLHDLHLASDEIRNDISYDASDEGRVGLPFIAAFILALACFNYLNIAIVSASKRLKEIGMRKVIGANRRLIILQFLTENMLLTFFAGVMGFVLAATVFLPWFSTFSGITSDFNLLDGNLWLTLLGILLFTGLVSGIYPAFYISKFPVIKIFRGSLKFGKKNLATKVFLTLQLILTCVGIGFAVIFAQNSWYQRNRAWGYNQKQLLYAELPEASDVKKLRDEMVKEVGVLSVAGSAHHLSAKYRTTIIHLPDHQYEVHELAVGADYLNTVGIGLKDGRFFEPNQESERGSIIINELCAQQLGLEDPIGKFLKINDESYRIIGLTEPFHFNNFYYQQYPTVFTLSEATDHRFLSIAVSEHTKADNFRAMQAAWSTLLPETPFNGGFQEDSWPGFYEDLNTQIRFTRAIAIIFILLASLGLYGLIQLNIKGRVREFSIRKTLGATAKNLTGNIASQYLLIFGIALTLGIPAAHVLNRAMLLMMFEDPLPYGFIGAIGSAMLLVIVLVIVIATQVRNVTRSNPVEGLKTE